MAIGNVVPTVIAVNGDGEASGASGAGFDHTLQLAVVGGEADDRSGVASTAGEEKEK